MNILSRKTIPEGFFQIYAVYALTIFFLGLLLETHSSFELPALWPLYYTGVPAGVSVAVEKIKDERLYDACFVTAVGAIIYVHLRYNYTVNAMDGVIYVYPREFRPGFQFDWSILKIAYFVAILWTLTARKSWSSNRSNLDSKILPEQLAASLRNKRYIFGVLLFSIALFVRLYDTSFLQGSDTFVLIAAKALHQHGQTHYNRFVLLSSTIATLFDWFTVSLFWARLPTITASSITVVLTYLIGLRLSKPVGIGAGVLMAISPWSISMAHFIRGYEINILLITGLVYGLIVLNERVQETRKAYPAIVLGGVFASAILVAFSEFDNNAAVKIGVLNVVVAASILLIDQLEEQGHDFIADTVKMLTVCGYALAFASAGIVTTFLTSLEPNTVWIQTFLNPFVPYPMLWYSFVDAAIVIVPVITTMGLLKYRNHRIFQIGLYIFLANLLLFTFRFENHLTQPATPRYIYHAHPFFSLIISAGLVTTIQVVKQWVENKKTTVFVSLALIFFLINPTNILIAMEESLGSTPEDSRSPTSIGNRDHLNHLFDFMRAQGFQGHDDILVTAGIHNYFIWEFDYPIEKNRTVPLAGGSYDIGENIYVESDYFSVHQLNSTLMRYDNGWYVQYSNAAPKKDFTRNGAELDYLGTRAGFNVYRWNSTETNRTDNRTSYSSDG